jgi:hypothetical protein
MLVIHVLFYFSSILLLTFQACILFYSTIPIPLCLLLIVVHFNVHIVCFVVMSILRVLIIA